MPLYHSIVPSIRFVSVTALYSKEPSHDIVFTALTIQKKAIALHEIGLDSVI